MRRGVAIAALWLVGAAAAGPAARGAVVVPTTTTTAAPIRTTTTVRATTTTARPTTTSPRITLPVLTTSTTRPATATTRRGTTTVTTAAGTTIPGETTVTPTTVETPTTALPTPFEPAAPATLRAVTYSGAHRGRRGVGLRVSGTGYAGCGDVNFFMAGRRLGRATAGGDRVATDALSVPGDAPLGTLEVTSSCAFDGRPVRASALFTVVDAAEHRVAMMTALPRPGMVDLSGARLAFSAAVAAALFLLLLFPFQLFNATLAENYDEVRGWFGLHGPRRERGRRVRAVAVAPFLVVTGLLYTLATPDFAFDRSTLLAGLGLAIGVTVTGLAFVVPGLLYARSRYGEWGRIRVLPGTIVVAAVTVGFSRLVGFLPGYLYGLLFVLTVRRRLDEQAEGRMGALTSVSVLAVSLGAWLLLVPVSHAAAEPRAGAGPLVAEAALSGVFLLGLESAIVDLLPLEFLAGKRIRAWRPIVWGALFGFALFALVHILLAPASGYLGDTPSRSFWTLGIGLLIAFGLGSFLFWGYFRFRPRPAGQLSDQPPR